MALTNLLPLSQATVELRPDGALEIDSQCFYQPAIVPLAEAYELIDNGRLPVYEESDDELIVIDAELVHTAVNAAISSALAQ